MRAGEPSSGLPALCAAGAWNRVCAVRHRITLFGLVLGALLAALNAGAAAASPPTSVTLHASRTHVTGPHSLTLSGRTAPLGVVQLFKRAYPYRSSRQIRSVTAGTAGGFEFVVHPDRNTRYRVQVVGTGAHAGVQIEVAGRTVVKVRPLALGRARVTVLVFHPADLRWGGVRARWHFGQGRRGRFRASSTTETTRLSRYVTLLRSTIAFPAGRFHWRVCFSAPGVGALADPSQPIGCRGRGYYGGGYLPYGYPGPGAIARASRYLASRSGRTAFAVVDGEGRISGVHMHWRFVSASVVKAMLLVAYLRRLHAEGRHTVDSGSNSFLYPMIHVSDNSAATHTWSIVGNSGLYGVAHAAGMTDYSVYTDWASSQISAYDQSRFFFHMDSLIPREFRFYARWLLSTIAAYESWGIPAVARPHGYRVFFKGGWRGTGLGQLVHQVARLEGHHRTFSIAVMTDGDPSMGYGIDTIQGVTAALL